MPATTDPAVRVLTTRPLRRPIEIPDLLAAGLAADPDAVAVTGADDRCTWRELAERAGRLPARAFRSACEQRADHTGHGLADVERRHRSPADLGAGASSRLAMHPRRGRGERRKGLGIRCEPRMVRRDERSEDAAEHIAAASHRGQQRVVATLAVAVDPSRALLVEPVGLAVGGVDIDGHRPRSGPGASLPGAGQGLAAPPCEKGAHRPSGLLSFAYFFVPKT